MATDGYAVSHGIWLFLFCGPLQLVITIPVVTSWLAILERTLSTTCSLGPLCGQQASWFSIGQRSEKCERFRRMCRIMTFMPEVIAWLRGPVSTSQSSWPGEVVLKTKLGFTSYSGAISGLRIHSSRMGDTVLGRSIRYYPATPTSYTLALS